ncbi:MAG: M23 family metallopeptidase [Sulfuricurvum sp.]
MARGRNSSSIFLVLFLALIVGVGGYVYTSQSFKRDAPAINMQTSGYWNLKKPLEITIDDELGIKSYRVSMITAGEESLLLNDQLLEPQKRVILKLDPPKAIFASKEEQVKIRIEANDSSKWNYFAGNLAIKEYSLVVDKKRPSVDVVSNSYKIKKGGSALVVFRAVDENLKDLHIETNFGKRFLATPFYKEGYYATLLAWPIAESSFRASVVATDMAGNETKVYIPYFLQDANYKVSNIDISDNFLHGKIAELADEFEETLGIEEPLEQFRAINETIREKNEILIHDVGSKVSKEMVDTISFKPMYPLKNAAAVASYGDHRHYFYNKAKLSESWHMGLDLASIAQAEIRTQNGGEVKFSDFNGLYGNMVMIDHSLGLYTLYGHCSSLSVNTGDYVKAGEVIAHSGKTGYAMGDHLHFGVLVQGVEVRPDEWMDAQWIKLNIDDVLANARSLIK